MASDYRFHQFAMAMAKALESLAEFALPVIEMLAALPKRANWGEWLEALDQLADRTLHDPERVQDKATFVKPHQFTEGFDVVLVNGQPVVEEGKLTGARPGQIVRHISQ